MHRTNHAYMQAQSLSQAQHAIQCCSSQHLGDRARADGSTHHRQDALKQLCSRACAIAGQAASPACGLEAASCWTSQHLEGRARADSGTHHGQDEQHARQQGAYPERPGRASALAPPSQAICPGAHPAPEPPAVPGLHTRGECQGCSQLPWMSANQRNRVSASCRLHLHAWFTCSKPHGSCAMHSSSTAEHTHARVCGGDPDSCNRRPGQAPEGWLSGT